MKIKILCILVLFISTLFLTFSSSVLGATYNLTPTVEPAAAPSTPLITWLAWIEKHCLVNSNIHDCVTPEPTATFIPTAPNVPTSTSTPTQTATPTPIGTPSLIATIPTVPTVPTLENISR